jgi:hypothetical protein
VLPVGDSTETGAMLYRSDLFRAGHLLRMYGIVYSDFFLQEKQKTLCRDVKNATKVCPESMLTYNRQRASFNNGLKNQLINDCFADAVAYIGPSGDLVREGVRKALFAIIRDIRMHETLSKAPIVFLSESLGSKVLGDSLLCVPKDALSDILPDLDRTTHVFLGANQIPLLNLGYRGERCEIESALEGLEKSGVPLYSISKKRGGIAGFLDILEAARVIKEGKVKLPRKGLDDRVVVAFTDPNDLLSYEVTPYDIGGRPVVNILVNNDFNYLRWIENPLKAHTGYRENPSVIEWLRCGRDADGNPTCP